MSMQWGLPDPPEEPLPSPPPFWVYIIVLVVLILAGAFITVANWPKEKPSMTGEFFGDIFALPAILWVFVCALIYHMGYEFKHLQVVTWNIQCWRYRVRQQQWARQTLAILGSSSITPEVELAERMLGLEGSMPMNPDKVMALSDLRAVEGETRPATVLEALLTPLVVTIMSVTRKGTFDIVVHSRAADDALELRRVWGKLKLPGPPEIRWSPCDSAFPSGEWLDSTSMPDFQLVVAWQLHEPGLDPTFSEAATALLLAKPAALERWKGKVKPQAHLYRPIVADSDAIGTGLANLLKGEQVPQDRIKHFWSSRLNRMTRHATKEAIKDGGLPAVEHDLDHAMGKPGPVNAWLLQALAAEMVQHGQGAQLVAVPFDTGVSFNLVGGEPAPVAIPYDARLTHSPVSIPTTLGILALATFLVLLPHPVFNTTVCLVVFAIALLLIAIMTGGDYLTRRLIEQQFWSRYG